MSKISCYDLTFLNKTRNLPERNVINVSSAPNMKLQVEVMNLEENPMYISMLVSYQCLQIHFPMTFLNEEKSVFKNLAGD
ncbi:CLUMA_CG017875, isoform A [Clunio marinus]|uniref:CLUMA_CG017875, isoform A n=1 Tax=Clunio marinus TaxID=568069 RepID=A0A1J1J081_9DIPT|nr:CLUMA_CG017875, isoform A [Clunio marinus]